MVVAPFEITTNVKKLICYTFNFIECKTRAPLGMSSGYISSNQLKAESSKDGQPPQARLHLAETAWQCNRWFSKKCWFQVCLISLDLTIRSISDECAIKVVAYKYIPITHTLAKMSL